MTIKTRFLLAFIGYTLLIMALFCGTFYIVETRSIIQEQRDNQVKTMEKAASVCREAYLASSAIVALNYIQILKKDPAVLFAAFLNPEGVVEAHSDPRWIGRKLEDTGSLQARQAKFLISQVYAGKEQFQILEWDSPVTVNNAKVGVVRVGYDRRIIDRALNEKLWDTLKKLILVAAFTFILALFASLMLAWNLTRPITYLVQGAKEIGGGNLHYQVPITDRSDELGYLSREFNAMGRKLSELDEMKQNFIQSITHDLKSPLSAIYGFTQILALKSVGPVNPEQDKLLKIIQTASKRLEQYINDILDVSKMEAGKFEIKREPVALAEVIGSVLEIQKGNAEELNVHLTANIPPGLPAVYADSKQLHRTLTNLISNGLKFTPKGGNVSVSASVEGDSQIRVEIRDTGAGIPESQLESIFEKFTQVQETQGKARQGGTGLGLTIVKQIINAHGGKIWVKSKLNEGASFIFTLPISEVLPSFKLPEAKD